MQTSESANGMFETLATYEQRMSGGLEKKLVAVMKSVDAVAKNGHNEKQDYDFVKATDVAREARKALVEHGVAFTYSVLTSDRWEAQTKSGGTMNYCQLMAEVTFSDQDTGASRTVQGIGWGSDTGDKAPYKAMTGLLKYVLRMNLLMPDDADPENDKGDTKSEPRPTVQRTSAKTVKVPAFDGNSMAVNGGDYIQPLDSTFLQPEDFPTFDENGEIVGMAGDAYEAPKTSAPITQIAKPGQFDANGGDAISEGKAKRLWAIAIQNGKKEFLSGYLAQVGISDAKKIPWKGKTYENAIAWAEQK